MTNRHSIWLGLGIGIAFAALFQPFIGIVQFNLSQPTPATLTHTEFSRFIEPSGATALTPYCATQTAWDEINARLDALDGGKVKTWSCPVPYWFDNAPRGTTTIQTIGKETPAQLGYSDCTLQSAPYPMVESDKFVEVTNTTKLK